jgi:hypothetical protein
LDLTVDPGGGSNITAEHFASAGDDSFPLTTDKAVTVSIRRSGGEVVVGYLDTINAGVTTPGEERKYSRDPLTGLPVAQVYLKADGEIEASNAAASIVIKANGDIEASNGIASIKINASGEIEITGTVIKAIAPDVQLGDGALDELVTKSFIAIYNSHTHPMGGVPSPQATSADQTVNTKAS